MIFPELLSNQFAILMADIQTGHLLKKDHSLFLIGTDIKDVFEILESLDEAKNFAFKKVADFPQIECVIYSQANKAVYYYSKDKQISLE